MTVENDEKADDTAHQERQRERIAALRTALIAGEQSGCAGALDMERIKTEARRRAKGL